MDEQGGDLGRDLMLDGNAVGGILAEVFGTEMTAASGTCGTCGNEGAVATLLAFTHAPGIVLRCPVCDAVQLRIVETPNGIRLDARGLAQLRIDRP